MTPPPLKPPNLLRDARVYLSGPMDFVADREAEKKFGWRNRIGQVLRTLGVVGLRPVVQAGDPRGAGLRPRGREGLGRPRRVDVRGHEGRRGPARGVRRRLLARAAHRPADGGHQRLRRSPTARRTSTASARRTRSSSARQQRKPVLFVSPPVHFPARRRTAPAPGTAGRHGRRRACSPRSSSRCRSSRTPTGARASGTCRSSAASTSSTASASTSTTRSSAGRSRHSTARRPRGLKKPLLPFLAKLNDELPKKWDRHKNDYVPERRLVAVGPAETDRTRRRRMQCSQQAPVPPRGRTLELGREEHVDVATATAATNSGSASFCSLHAPDLEYKHARMSDPHDPFPFFRGTYYRWAHCGRRSARTRRRTAGARRSGDLHVENFGTWRDADGRLCWGVNDFDEADELPYTNDLVRLAASAHDWPVRPGELQHQARVGLPRDPDRLSRCARRRRDAIRPGGATPGAARWRWLANAIRCGSGGS